MIDVDGLIKEAMKSKDKVALNAYRNIKVEIQKNQTAKGAKPLTKELQLKIISKYSANLQNAILEFNKAGREDLVSEYMSEWEAVQELLPVPIDASKIYSFIENDEEYFEKFWFTEFDDNDETTHMELQIPKKEMGNAIKYIKSKFPTADGKMISEIIKSYIV